MSWQDEVQELDTRPRLNLEGDDDAENVDEIYRVAKESDVFFKRGGELVRIIRVQGRDQMDPLTVTSLQAHIGDAFRIYAPKKVEGEWEMCRASGLKRALSQHTLDRGDKGVHELERVRRAPVYADTYDLINSPGFHIGAKTWLDMEPLTGTDVPDGTRLEQARGYIDEWLCDFPFKTESDKANAVAMALTPFIQPIVGRAPLFAITAPVHGSGKTLAAETMGVIAHGEASIKISWAEDEAENEKRIVSTLRQSPPYVIIDNVNDELDSAALATLLTSSVYTGRVLGSSRMVRLSNDAVWCVTGNNPQFSGELVRRVCPIRLEPDEERPADRDFRHPDLEAWVERNRTRLVWALLELVEAWKLADSPRVEMEWGSYQAWAKACASILTHAGYEGFAKNRDTIASRKEDDLTQLVLMWLERPDLINFAKPSDLERLCEDADALLRQRGGSQSAAWRARKLSEWLQGHTGRVVRGRRIVSDQDSRNGNTVFKLEPVH